jgi:hypothetical protein
MASASAGKAAMRRSRRAWSAYACEMKSLRGNPWERGCVGVKNSLSHIVGQYIAPDAASGDTDAVGTITAIYRSTLYDIVAQPSWLLSDTFTPPQRRLGSAGHNWASRRSPPSPFVDHQPARHPKSGGVSAQESDVIPATRGYPASVLSGELPVSGEFLN